MIARRAPAPFARRPLLVTARQQIGAYVTLRARDEDGPAPAAGQFYMLSTAEGWGGGEDDRPFLPRAFSVMRHHPAEAELEFLLEAVGPGTRRLAGLGPGESLMVLGPLGEPYRPPGEDRRAVLVGGGVGIAPLAILHDQLVGAGGGGAAMPPPPQDVTVLLGFRDAAHAAGAAVLPGARLATDDGSRGHHGLVTDLLRAELDRDAGAEIFACGPPAMLESVRRLCAETGTPGQLALETGMACGFGACFGCAVATRRGLVRLCLEGPVLDAADLAEVAAH